MSDRATRATTGDAWLDGATIDPSVFQLRPDYRALLITIDGIVTGPTDSVSEALLQAAEATARKALAACKPEDLPHVAAWRDAYRSFGVRPQKFRHSLEQLLRRAEAGLPRVNAVVDAYNAVCVTWQVPIGGEDKDRYASPPRLLRASGHEPFDSLAAGQEVIEHPEPGEVVWTDDAGVTCRRWNWRQCRRTAITGSTTSTAFVLDALDPLSDQTLDAAADELIAHLARLGPDVVVHRRLLTPEWT